MKYQVIALGGSHDGRTAALFATLRRGATDLGLEPADALELFDDPDVLLVGTGRAPTACVFFGSPSRPAATDEAATILRNRGVFILPIVPDVARYRSYVPDSLLAINGLAADPADPHLESVAQRVLEELRLVREKRLVFISYRRDESSAVAEQLYRAFDDRAFDVFLDTHSVRGGSEFQSVLWDRMADADLLVLIDTPGALSSRWVSEELARAGALGLGALQLVWPGHTRTPGTEFCEPVFLEAADLEPPSGAVPAQVRVIGLRIQSIVSLAEGLRARSLAARRSRIVGEVWRRATAAGAMANIQPARWLDLQSPHGGLCRVFPVVGHPDSLDIYRCSEERGGRHVDGVVLYDPLGMLDKTRLHLGWLNAYLPLKAVPVTELDEWFRHL